MGRILIITGTTEANSGLGRYSREVIKELRNQGEDVLVLSERGDRNADLIRKGTLSSFFRNILMARKLAARAEIVHALDAWPFAIFGMAAVFATKKKLFITGVGTYSIPPSRRSFKRALLLMAYHRAKHVFCISSYVLETIKKHLPFNPTMTVVHLAATQMPDPEPDIATRLRNRYQIPRDAVIILTVGDIKERKGQLDTLRAVLSLRQLHQSLVYVMVGSDSDIQYVNSIRAEAHDRNDNESFRIVTDAKSDMDLSAWYSMARVFALTSNNVHGHFEGFGLVFLEAAQFGVPGVGTRGCGIEDAIIDGQTGRLALQRDSYAIALAILEVLKKRDFFSQNVLNFSTKFSWRRTIASFRRNYYN